MKITEFIKNEIGRIHKIQILESKKKEIEKKIKLLNENDLNTDDEMETFFVKYSSWFDTHPYDKEKIAKAIKYSGGKNIGIENMYGWSNQPDVVVFDSTKNMIPKIKKSIQNACETEWIILSKKGW